MDIWNAHCPWVYYFLWNSKLIRAPLVSSIAESRPECNCHNLSCKKGKAHPKHGDGPVVKPKEEQGTSTYLYSVHPRILKWYRLGWIETQKTLRYHIHKLHPCHGGLQRTCNWAEKNLLSKPSSYDEVSLETYRGFLKCLVPYNDHFGVFWGYHHLRKHPFYHAT